MIHVIVKGDDPTVNPSLVQTVGMFSESNYMNPLLNMIIGPHYHIFREGGSEGGREGGCNERGREGGRSEEGRGERDGKRNTGKEKGRKKERREKREISKTK